MNLRQIEEMDYFYVYPARHFVIPEEKKARAIASILEELDSMLPSMGMLDSHRLKQRTPYDTEMIEETGSCKGIENYSRHFDNPGGSEQRHRRGDDLRWGRHVPRERGAFDDPVRELHCERTRFRRSCL